MSPSWFGWLSGCSWAPFVYRVGVWKLQKSEPGVWVACVVLWLPEGGGPFPVSLSWMLFWCTCIFAVEEATLVERSALVFGRPRDASPSVPAFMYRLKSERIEHWPICVQVSLYQSN